MAVALLTPGIGVSQGTPPPRPDCTAAEYRQFDFWLGEWQVQNAVNDKLAGANSITSTMDGCVLHEHWRGMGGVVGQSFNIFDRHSGKWHQFWVDSTGMRLQLVGGIEDGRMVLTGEMPHREHGQVQHRIVWTPEPDGTVRQVWTYAIDGNEWQTLFDGRYTRSAAAE